MIHMRQPFGRSLALKQQPVRDVPNAMLRIADILQQRQRMPPLRPGDLPRNYCLISLLR